MTGIPAAAVEAATEAVTRADMAGAFFQPEPHAVLARAALDAAAPHIAAAERERIRQLATSHAADGAKCAKGVAVRPTCQCATWNPRFSFAHLLTEGDT